MTFRNQRAPRITAEHEINENDSGRLIGDRYVTPYVNVEVRFDLGDDEQALKLLRAAFSDVIRQIGEVSNRTQPS